MPGRKRSDEWYSPYFAPSTIVVGVLVIIVSIGAGRYVGNLTIERDKARYSHVTGIASSTENVAPTKATRPTSVTHGKLSPSAKVSQ